MSVLSMILRPLIKFQLGDVYSQEESRWLDHNVVKETVDAERVMHSRRLVEDATEMSLCFYEGDMYGQPYLHYFVMLHPAKHIIEFHGTDHLNSILEVHTKSITRPYSREPQSKILQVTDAVRRRVDEVLFMRNYSLVLRNCEHVAKYIFWGKWWSNQLAVSENLMNKFLDLVDRKDIKKLSNTPPFNLWRFGLERGQVVEEVKDVWDFKFRTKFTYYEPATFNVLLIGPTGAGKSNIINAVFKEPVAESGRRATGVSQAVMFYNGVMRTPKQENVRINLIDTIGFCDRVIPESEIVGMIRHLVLHKDVPIHKVLVIFGERIRDSEQDALKEYLKMMKFAENHDLFSLVLTKCNDMDSFERSSYSSSFHEVPLLQNFVNNLNGTSVTSDKPVLVPRTVCVDLIDITKVAGREEYYSNERARLLETMLFFTNTHISMKDSFC